jgi:hypothetical protein
MQLFSLRPQGGALGSVLIAFWAVGFSGCGKSQDEDAARVVGFLSSKSTSVAVRIADEVKGQALLQRFAAEAGETVAPQLSLVPFAGQRSLEIDDAIYTCDLIAIEGYELATTCTTSADDRFSCGDESYVIKSGATMKMGISTTADQVFRIYLEQSATVTGGGLGSDGKKVACTIEMSFDLAKLAAAAESGEAVDPYTFSCSGEINCTIGEETLSCEELQAAMNDYAKSGAVCTDSAETLLN